MTVVVWALLSLFTVKIIWNLCVPYILLMRFRKEPDKETGWISMKIVVEIFLLLLAVGMSALSTGQALVNKPLTVAKWGIIAIIFTYLHLFIVCGIGGWIIKVFYSQDKKG